MNANKASPSPPPPSSSFDEDRENIIILTPASTTVSDEGGELADKSGSDTISSNHNNDNNRSDNDHDDTNDDQDKHPRNDDHDDTRTNFDWNTTAFNRSQGLLAQVGSLSKELTELKALIARSTSSGTGSVSDEQAEDLSRVKANHRSSLASLAESHRTEMSSLAITHQDEIKRLEQAHEKDMRNARRGFGFSSELVQGLHESYSQQIQSLVLDLSEVRRQLKDAKAKSGASPASPVQEVGDSSCPTRRLCMVLRFDDLDEAFSIAELSIPHPGRSFKAVWKHLSHAVTNYLQTLNAAAEFFAVGSKAGEARKIRHWHQCACDEKIQFRFLHGKEGDDIKDLWETELWSNDNFTLRVICVAEEAWSNVPVFNDEEFVETPKNVTRAGTRREPLGPASEEQLVQVETTNTVEGFNVGAEFERINRELGELEINDSLHGLEDDDENKENIEHPMPKRHVMVEEVTDEEDHLYRDDPEDEGVGLAISSSPVPATPLEKEPLLPGNSGRRSMPGVKPLGDQSYIDKFLGTEKERERQERRTTGGSSGSDSWLFDDLFSPLPADKGKGKEKIAGLFEEREQDAEDQRDHFGISKPAWKWMLTADGVVKTPPASHATPHTAAQSYFKGEKPWLERLREEEEDGEDDRLASDNDQPIFSEQEDMVPGKKDRPFFSFSEEAATSPAPPPAPPAPELRKSPTLPAYLRDEMFEGARLDEEDSDIDDNQPRDVGDLENPFAELKPGQCDTPVMGTSRSAASTTPLLRDGSPAPRNQNRGGPSLKIQTDHQKPSRLADPFVPLPKGPPKCNLPQHKPSSRFSRGYGFQNVDREDDDKTLDTWETGSDASNTTIEGWEARRQRKCGRGVGSEAYTWRHNHLAGEDDSFRSRSVSPHIPSPSRSSVTTTDRGPDFILPAPTYPQGMGLSSNLNPMRYGGAMRTNGPLGPGHHSMPAGYTNPQQQQQQQQAEIAAFQMKKMNEAMFAANYGIPRQASAGPPPFVGGPVYAPNPPHSVVTFNGGGVPIRPTFLGGGAEQRLASEAGSAWPMRPMLMQPHLVNHQLWGPNGEPRRSYSTDSTGPLLWKVDDGLRQSEGLGLMQQQQAAAQQHAQAQHQQQAQQQAQQAQQQQQNLISGPLMSSQQGTRPPSTMSMSLEQAAFGSAAGLGSPWAAALANAYGQPGTPGSAHALSPGWFALQQGQQVSGPGFESMWAGSSLGMPAHWGGGAFQG